jgi:hypothetical protein
LCLVDITERERERERLGYFLCVFDELGVVLFCRVERGKGTEGKKQEKRIMGLEERSDDDDDYGV